MENAECEHLIFERDGSSRLLIQLGSELTRLSKPSFTVPGYNYYRSVFTSPGMGCLQGIWK